MVSPSSSTGAPDYTGLSDYQCAGDCTDFAISVGQTIYIPGTNCVQNKNNGFNAWVCDQPGGYGNGVCTQLDDLPFGVKGGTANQRLYWSAPGTKSMTRIS